MDKRKKILAVDDNPSNIAIIEELLEDRFDLRLACSGEQALEIADRFKPDLILLDIMMPGMDGYQVCRKIRKKPSHRDTKIIMVTAKALTVERLAGYEAGADDYVTKPFDGDELLAKIGPYLYLKDIELIQGELTDADADGIPAAMAVIGDMIPGPQQDETPDQAEIRLCDQINNTTDQITHLARVIHDFFDITRIDTGSMELKKQQFDAALLVNEVLTEFEIAADKKDISLNEESPSEQITLCADRKKIAQVLRHLIDNAVRYNQQGGFVSVRVDTSGDQICIEIEDDGPGVGEDVIEAIYSKSIQKIRDIGSVRQGTGLGLSVAKGIIELHGGSISAENKVEGGAIFTVQLPAYNEYENSVIKAGMQAI